MSSLLDSVKSTFSTTPPAEEDTGDGDTFFTQGKTILPKLSYKQRLIGFGICIGIAALLAILGCALGGASLAVLAVLFTLGTIAGICSTFFLVSPIKQAKNMYDPSNVTGMVVKIVCIITVFLMIVLVFCAAFWWKVPVVAILFCIILFIAIVIYAIALIPYATTIISHGIKSTYSTMTS